MPDHNNRLARLKLLFVAAKAQSHAGQSLVRNSMHDDWAASLIRFIEFLDRRRKRLGHAVKTTVQQILCINCHYKLLGDKIRLRAA